MLFSFFRELFPRKSRNRDVYEDQLFPHVMSQRNDRAKGIVSLELKAFNV